MVHSVTLGEEIGWEDDPTAERYNVTSVQKNNSSKPLAHQPNPYESAEGKSANFSSIKSIIIEAYSESGC